MKNKTFRKMLADATTRQPVLPYQRYVIFPVNRGELVKRCYDFDIECMPAVEQDGYLLKAKSFESLRDFLSSWGDVVHNVDLSWIPKGMPLMKKKFTVLPSTPRGVEYSEDILSPWN